MDHHNSRSHLSPRTQEDRKASKRTRSELRMRALALTNAWDMPADLQQEIVSEMRNMLNNGTPKEKYLAACTFIKMGEMNVKLCSLDDEEETGTVNLTQVNISPENAPQLHRILEQISGIKRAVAPVEEITPDTDQSLPETH